MTNEKTMAVPVILLFTGTIFITSDLFVNPVNTPKWHFLIVFGTYVTGLLLFLRNSRPHKPSVDIDFILKGVFLIAISQALYGLLQYSGILSSNHQFFKITGSFDNPAGFAAVLSFMHPVGLHLLNNAPQRGRKYWLTATLFIFTTVVLSGSRTGILAFIISTLVFFSYQSQLTQYIKRHKHFHPAFIIAILLFISLAVGLFYLKPDSVKGRFLIWRISADMIKEKPWIGHGPDGFSANYMQFQANYFKSHPDSGLKNLADNTAHPFNEFLKITIEHGISGLMLLLVLVFLLFRFVKRQCPSSEKRIILSGFSAIIMFSCLSYPFQYSPVTLILIGYLLLAVKEMKRLKSKQLIPVFKFIYGPIMIIITITFIVKINTEIHWKKTAMKAIKGAPEATVCDYQELLPKLRNNPLFLYNYGATLNAAGNHKKSQGILKQCSNDLNDYDLQMIMADNLLNLKDTIKAINTYRLASNMIPARFLPLYHLMEIHKAQNNITDAQQMASKINTMPVKVMSPSVFRIKQEAQKYLDIIEKNKLSITIDR